MRPTATTLLGCLFLALLVVAGCDDSQNSLSSPGKSKPDEKLIGVWRHRDNGSTTYYLVGRLGGKAPKSVMRLVTVTRQKNGELERPYQAVVFPTVLDGVSYLNVAGASQKQLAQIRENGWRPDLLDAYFILKYRPEENAIVAWSMDFDAKKKAIEVGKIKGQTKTEKTPAKFTDTTENLAKFVSGAKDTLFRKEPLRFERVR